MEKYKCAIFIGRFQPYHLGHEEILKQSLEIAEKVLIIIGSSKAAFTIKNPFSWSERMMMIRESLSEEDQKRVIFENQRDYYYDDSLWRLDLTEKIKKHFNLTDSLALVGQYKDNSSYYLTNLQFLEFVPLKNHHHTNLDATEIRTRMFENPESESMKWNDKLSPKSHWKNLVPTNVYKYINGLYSNLHTGSPRFKRLREEYNYLKKYKEQWSRTPYPPTFLTSDYVLRCEGHILLVKRKFGHGKGLLALPGGFVRQHETTRQAALRELKEETCLDIDKEKLEDAIKQEKVFDHPNRSPRGRTVTHAFFGTITATKDLPRVEGADDAAEALWLPIFEIYEKSDEFFEDHFHIIHNFLTTQGE